MGLQMCHIKSTEKPMSEAVIVNSQIVVPLSEQCGWRSIGVLLLPRCWGLGQVSNSAGGFFCGVPTDHKKHNTTDSETAGRFFNYEHFWPLKK